MTFFLRSNLRRLPNPMERYESERLDGIEESIAELVATDKKRAEELRNEMKEREDGFEKYAEKIDKVGKLPGSIGV